MGLSSKTGRRCSNISNRLPGESGRNTSSTLVTSNQSKRNPFAGVEYTLRFISSIHRIDWAASTTSHSLKICIFYAQHYKGSRSCTSWLDISGPMRTCWALTVRGGWRYGSIAISARIISSGRIITKGLSRRMNAHRKKWWGRSWKWSRTIRLMRIVGYRGLHHLWAIKLI